MRGIGRVPKGPLRQIIRENTESYELDHPDPDSSSYSGQEYISKNESADLYLFSPQEITEIMISGEQESGSLQGLCLPVETDGVKHAPVDEDDRLNYGQGRYEIETVTPMPDATNPDVYELTLERTVESSL